MVSSVGALGLKESELPTKLGQPPDEVGASHILIGYKGAMRSKATRSKAEARTLAEKVLAEARAQGADFAELARDYSRDRRSGEVGGDIGYFGPDQIDSKQAAEVPQPGLVGVYRKLST